MGENKIFVAVGKEVEERKSTLKWALKKWKGGTFCVVYVHVPSHMIPLPTTASSVSEAEVRAFREQERKEAIKILDDCLQICAQHKVPSEKLCIKKDSITDGILELIVQQRITNLVMGAQARSIFSRKKGKLKSKKANYLLNCAPDFCCIWFIWKGHLVHNGQGKNQANQHVEDDKSLRPSYSEPIVYSPSTGSVGSSSPVTQSMCLDSSPWSTPLTSIINEDLYKKLEQALEEAEKSRQEAVVESERRQKAENETIEAISQKREVEEELKQVKEELKEAMIELHKYSHTFLKVAKKISSVKEGS